MAEFGFRYVILSAARRLSGVPGAKAARWRWRKPRADGACSTIMSVHSSVGCVPILKYGSDDQKARFLPRLASPRANGSAASPSTGQRIRSVLAEDAGAARRRPLRHRRREQLITSGKNGKVVIVFAVTDPDAGKKGITAFIVPTDTPGYEVVSVEHKLGQHASDTCALASPICACRSKNRLGDEGQGYRIALANLEGGRTGIAAQAVGMARGAYEAALAYARDRITFGRPIIEHQGGGLPNSPTWQPRRGPPAGPARGAAARGRQTLPDRGQHGQAFRPEMAEKVISDAIQIHGVMLPPARLPGRAHLSRRPRLPDL